MKKRSKPMRPGLSDKVERRKRAGLHKELGFLVLLFIPLFLGMTRQQAFDFYKQEHCSSQVSCQPSLQCDNTIPYWSVFFYWERLWDTVDSLPMLFQKTIEAETMIKTTGGAVTGGWSIWSNGNIKESVNFPNSTIYQFEILARG